MAGMLNLIKLRGYSMHLEGRWLEEPEKVSLKFWMETYKAWDIGSIFIFPVFRIGQEGFKQKFEASKRKKKMKQNKQNIDLIFD